MRLFPKAWGKKKTNLKTHRPAARVIRARYDAAQTTDENRRYWANADNYSADSANSPEVRSTLRKRARYEVANNSYAKGIVLTLANDCVGTGPRLQLLGENAEENRRVEAEFGFWAATVNLPEKLRTLRMAKTTDGEGFAILHLNPLLDSAIPLDISLIEAEQVASPIFSLRNSPCNVDGIQLDAFGNPETYYVLSEHPGESGLAFGEGLSIPASAVLHYFRADRPGQHRGIPELTPALELFGQLRRYTLAVLGAAETAADFAAVLYSDGPADDEEDADAPEAMDLISLEKRMATVLPDGWKLGQIKAEQPATSYGEFKREILNEIARCLNLPYNIAACNSSGYNYASGRLDHQTYYKAIRVEQAHLSTAVLDRIFAAWCREAYVLGLLGEPQIPAHQWFFDGAEHVDPAKEASAQATRLSSLTTTYATEFAKQGKDWEVELRQRAKETQLITELGLSTSPAPLPPEDTDENDPDEPDTESA